jgi:hypothetical protein
VQHSTAAEDDTGSGRHAALEKITPCGHDNSSHGLFLRRRVSDHAELERKLSHSRWNEQPKSKKHSIVGGHFSGHAGSASREGFCGSMSQLGLGCVKTPRHATAIEEVIRPRQL